MLKTATSSTPKFTFARLTIKYRFIYRTRERSDKDLSLDPKTFIHTDSIRFMLLNYPEDL